MTKSNMIKTNDLVQFNRPVAIQGLSNQVYLAEEARYMESSEVPNSMSGLVSLKDYPVMVDAKLLTIFEPSKVDSVNLPSIQFSPEESLQVKHELLDIVEFDATDESVNLYVDGEYFGYTDDLNEEQLFDKLMKFFLLMGRNRDAFLRLTELYDFDLD